MNRDWLDACLHVVLLVELLAICVAAYVGAAVMFGREAL